MKNCSIQKPLPLIVTVIICLVFVSFGAVAFSAEADIPPVQTEATERETTPVSAPDTSGDKSTSSYPWWGIGIGVVVVIVILYFVFANMERKASSEFETTIIDDIVTAMKDEFSLSENDLRDLAAGIIATRHCSDSRLSGLLRIEYEVEKTSASRAKRTTAVALKKQNDVIVRKATRTMTWDDLPAPIRKEFILKNETVLVYSLYSDDEKEG